MDNESQPVVGRKLENLSLEDMEEFDPRAVDTNGVNNGLNGMVMTNGHKNGNGTNGHSMINGQKDIFGSEPFHPDLEKGAEDPFGMGSFQAKQLDQAIGAIDKKLAEMRDGFSRGLSFGNDDFSVEALDPLAPKH
jgi:hypothetical protein